MKVNLDMGIADALYQPTKLLARKEELKQKLDDREGKRSKSFFRRVMHEEIKRCSWNFAFKLQFEEKEYELYAATRSDRDQWVKILGTVAEMNR